MAVITAVSGLKLFKSMWKIRVKIIRLWKQYSAAGGKTIEMVLSDSNGVKVNATVKKDLVNQFDSFLSQESSKILINFSLNPSCRSYRTTPLGGLTYVTNMEGVSEILFDTDIPEIQFFKSQFPIIDF